MLSDTELEKYRQGWQQRRAQKEKELQNKKKLGRKKAFKIAQLLKENYNVKKVFLFGSISDKSSSRVHQHSDIDIAYVSEKINYLQAFGDVLDIAAPFKVDLVPLNEATPKLKKRIKLYGEEI
ncbi:MAG: nucleotidyltransferase domain-containing protein [Halanaerobiales bacterium]